MRKLMLIALAVGATVILSACGSSTPSALTGKAWQLTAITEKSPAFQGVVPPADQSRYVITFNKDGTFNATADCNQVSGTYKTPGSDGLTITTGASTLAMCAEGSLDLLFVHGLSQAKTYAVVTDTLTITLSDEGTMVFVIGVAASSPPAASAGASDVAATATAAPTAKPTAAPTAAPTAKPTAKPTAAPTAAPTAKPTAAPTAAPTAKPTAAPTAKPTAAPSPATGLLGKAWQLTAITEQEPAFQGVVPEDQRANYTIEFLADNSFSARADCNTISGTYATADATSASGDLTVTPLAGTTAACPDGSLADLYVLGLTNAASYAVVNGQLTVTLLDKGTLVYQ